MPTLSSNVPGDLASVRAIAQEIAVDVAREHARSVDAEARWPRETLTALREAGLAGLVIPESQGGIGQGLLALSQVCESLGEHCPSSALCFGMHCVGSAVIAAKATPEQRSTYLSPIVAGEHLTTLALSEFGTGAHFYLPQTKLEGLSNGTFSINGSKTFVTNGGQADSYVISTMAAEPNAPLDQFSCVVVPKDADGLEWGPEWNGLGMRGNSSRSLELKGVVVPRENLLGTEGEQLWYVFNVIAPYFLSAMAGTYLGLANAALDEVKSHLTTRYHTHSGSMLGEQQLFQHRVGQLWAIVERTRRLIYHAASTYDDGLPDPLPAIFSAKAEVADCAVTVVNEVMTLVGGIGYQAGSRVQQLLRDARAAHIMSPTTDLLRTWTGRALLGQPLLGD